MALSNSKRIYKDWVYNYEVLECNLTYKKLAISSIGYIVVITMTSFTCSSSSNIYKKSPHLSLTSSSLGTLS